MFSFKSVALILAAATALVSAIPTSPLAEAGLAKREAAPAPLEAIVARLAEPVVASPVLAARGAAPTDVPGCIKQCSDTCAPILAQIGMSFVPLLEPEYMYGN